MEWYQTLGLKYPLFQGGMAWASNPELVAAVSNAGALGIIGSGGRSAQQLQNMIQKTRQLTQQPFGVNLMLLEPNIQELVKIVCHEKIAIVTTGAGNPAKYLSQLNMAGIKVFPVIPNVKIAQKMLQLPINGLIAEGIEAGGHIGTETTFTLVPQITAISDLPVLAAGGIYDYPDFQAAKILGAAGIQAGTAFLAAQECQIAPEYQKLLCQSSNPGTMLAKTSSGYWARVLKNPGKSSTNVSLKAAVQMGDLKNGAFMAGQVADRITQIEPAEKIIKRIINK
jgi:enoyl-[acyl-carrier protein] reductase II